MAEEDTPIDPNEQMFAAIGRAISVWGMVEERLAVIYTVCAGIVVPIDETTMWLLDREVPTHVFYSLETFHAKRTILNAAVDAFVQGIPQERDLLNEWGKLSQKARELARLRNKLAHWNVSGGYSGAQPSRLMPPFGSPTWWAEIDNPKRSLTQIQIGHISKAFRLFDSKLHCFTRKLAETAELRDKDVRQALRLLQRETRLSQSAREEIERLLASPELR